MRRYPSANQQSTPLLRTTTGVQNPSESVAVVSFRDDYIKWGRIEVSWGVNLLLADLLLFLVQTLHHK